MYDTLMQMGRWFGYRPGYLDLCRLFTTHTLKAWYRHIALAEEELRREFDYMVNAGLTPENYGLRVRTHPDGMIVTALNKMSHGRTLELSWAGVLAQTTQLPKDKSRITANLAAAETLLTGLPKPERGVGRDTRVWTGVPAASVARFIRTLQLPPASARASGEQLSAFISKQTQKPRPELTEWTVALISNARTSADRFRTLAGYDIGLIERNPEDQTESSYALIRANILNPADEAIDFEDGTFDQAWFDAIAPKPALRDDIEWLNGLVGQESQKVALDLTLRWQGTEPAKIRKPQSGITNRPNGRVLRALRKPSDGLLLIYPLLPPEFVAAEEGKPPQRTGLISSGSPIIGVALSFPDSETALGIEYRVNKVWGAEIQEDAAYED
jgi:hypothetical protein